ncbi:MAG: alanyl-tRNA synthetase [Bryobacterales bacterium]|jgi:alanyl-tRNA synthetase|nr:alanyl-tRNA synthetase [Bryobacterales bacterium]
MTERLYYQDCYLREFSARVVETADDGRRVYLDRTAFYPTSGGQPFDLGSLGGVAVREVIDEEDRIAHLLEAALTAAEVEGSIDWQRRYDHMQQHTGQHLLSAVLEELFKIRTVSFHLGAETSTIDVDAPSLTPEQLDRVEERCAEVIAQACPIHITFEDASATLELRKASARGGTLRIVSIDGVDRSACGGTHLRTAAEIGVILTGKTEKIRGNTRLEFVCGTRALHRARADNRLLASIGRALSVPPEQTPELLAGLIEKNKSLEKTTQRLATELARREGRELFLATTPDADGIRRLIQRGPIDDAMRARAQAFVAGEKSVFLAVCDQPPSLLLAASADSGIHAGDRVKAAVTASGGRGGGNQQLAQGSVPDSAALAGAEALLR